MITFHTHSWLFQVFVIVFLSTYALTKDNSLFSIIFIAMFVSAIGFNKALNIYDTKHHKQTSDKFWKTVSKQLQDYEIVNDQVFLVHKPPETLKYLFFHPQVVDTLEDLKFMLIYEKDLFLRLIIYIEWFMKVQYNIMIEKYNACSFYPILRDLRREIMNILASLVFNMKPYSNILDIPNMIEFTQLRTRNIQTITWRYMTIVKHKYNHTCSHVMEDDVSWNDKYSTFDIFV